MGNKGCPHCGFKTLCAYCHTDIEELGWQFAPPGSVVLDPDEARLFVDHVNGELTDDREDALLNLVAKLSRQEAPE